ncbi:MAG TPA: hypothetical protein VMR52_05935 [Dehalococcoidia bacterium]|nr:hypothetical protein [Dehalococcoidia bacterium]
MKFVMYPEAPWKMPVPESTFQAIAPADRPSDAGAHAAGRQLAETNGVAAAEVDRSSLSERAVAGDDGNRLELDGRAESGGRLAARQRGQGAGRTSPRIGVERSG